MPPWGQQLIIALGDVNDIVSDMRVLSTVQTSAVGSDGYVNSEQWDLVEFNYKGKKISSPPSAIPEIGQVVIPAYTSKEVCGVLFIDKHDIDNVVGGLIKWAINTALSLVTCNSQRRAVLQLGGPGARADHRLRHAGRAARRAHRVALVGRALHRPVD